MMLTSKTTGQKVAISNSPLEDGESKVESTKSVNTVMAPLILEKHVLNRGLSQHPIRWLTCGYHSKLYRLPLPCQGLGQGLWNVQ